MRSDFGYPGIRTAMKASTEPTAHDVVTEERPYLCVSYDTEKQTVQPLRLVGGLVAGPLVMYASTQLREERPVMKASLLVTGAAISYWCLWVWNKADTEMTKGPR